MVNKILTPITLWEDFFIAKYKVSLVSESFSDGITVREYFLTRPAFDAQEVKIYIKIVFLGKVEGKKAIYYLQSPTDKVSSQRLVELAEMGYVAVCADIAGLPCETVVVDDNTSIEPKTVYPENLSFATIEGYLQNPLYIGVNAKYTAFYQWTVNAKYVIDFLRKKGMDKICVLADGVLVNTAFQLGATEDLSSIVALYGSGWNTPLGNKYGENVKIDFNEDELKFIAGIEAQSYASYVNCPTLMCVVTNSPKCDIDRAYDTFSRIREDVYSAMVYTVGLGQYFNYKTYSDVSIFISKYFGENDMVLPNETFTEVKIEDGKIVVKATFDDNAENVSIHASEGEIIPQYRCWKKIAETNSITENSFETEFTPTGASRIAFFFTEVTYKNGFTMTSAVMPKRFTDTDVKIAPRFNTVYSPLEKYKDGIFECIQSNVKTILGMKTVYEPVLTKVGARDIVGVDASRGLRTFNVQNPTDDAMLVLSVCAKEDFAVTIELVTDAFTGEQKSYRATYRLKGGNLWHELQTEIARFKTEEGYPLKTYARLKAIRIYANVDFCVNNVLWV